MMKDVIIKALGGFLTSMGILMLKQSQTNFGWTAFFFTVGLALLFLPKIEK